MGTRSEYNQAHTQVYICLDELVEEGKIRVKSSTYPILRLFNGVFGGGQGESKIKHIPNFTSV